MLKKIIVQQGPSTYELGGSNNRVGFWFRIETNACRRRKWIRTCLV